MKRKALAERRPSHASAVGLKSQAWLAWAALFLLLGAMARLLGDRSETHRRVEREEAAEEALRSRFAAGEIDEEEYQRRLRILRETHSG